MLATAPFCVLRREAGTQCGSRRADCAPPECGCRYKDEPDLGSEPSGRCQYANRCERLSTMSVRNYCPREPEKALGKWCHLRGFYRMKRHSFNRKAKEGREYGRPNVFFCKKKKKKKFHWNEALPIHAHTIYICLCYNNTITTETGNLKAWKLEHVFFPVLCRNSRLRSA